MKALDTGTHETSPLETIAVSGLSDKETEESFIKNVLFPYFENQIRDDNVQEPQKSLLAKITSPQGQSLLQRDSVFQFFANSRIWDCASVDEAIKFIGKFLQAVPGLKNKMFHMPRFLGAVEGTFSEEEQKQRYHLLASTPWHISNMYSSEFQIYIKKVKLCYGKMEGGFCDLYREKGHCDGCQQREEDSKKGSPSPLPDYVDFFGKYFAVEYIKETGKTNIEADFFTWLHSNLYFQKAQKAKDIWAFWSAVSLSDLKNQMNKVFYGPLEILSPDGIELFHQHVRPQEGAMGMVDFLNESINYVHQGGCIDRQIEGEGEVHKHLLEILSGRSSYGLSQRTATPEEFQRINAALRSVLEGNRTICTQSVFGLLPKEKKDLTDHAINISLCALAIWFKDATDVDKITLVHKWIQDELNNMTQVIRRERPAQILKNRMGRVGFVEDIETDSHTHITLQNVAQRFMDMEDTFHAPGYFIRDRDALRDHIGR